MMSVFLLVVLISLVPFVSAHPIPCKLPWPRSFCDNPPTTEERASKAIFVGTVGSIARRGDPSNPVFSGWTESSEQLLYHWRGLLTPFEQEEISRAGPADPKLNLYQYSRCVIRLRVDESFANSRPGDSVELMVAPLSTEFGLSPESANNCGYSIGEQLLVDATRVGSRWTSGICNRTASVRDAALDIHALRAWKAGTQPVPAIGGMVHDGAPSPDATLLRRQPLSLRVRIAGDGIQHEVRTQSDGSFFQAGLRHSKYRVSFVEPGWRIADSGPDPEYDLTTKACAAASFYVKKQ